MKLIYGVEDKPKFGQLLIFALQQLLAIMTATLVVPVVINQACGTNLSSAAALLGAGLGTLIYVLFTKKKSPVFLGSSFAFIGSMIAAFAGGVSVSLGFLGLIMGAAFAALVYVIIAVVVVDGARAETEILVAVDISIDRELDTAVGYLAEVLILV